ncbi:EscU/YscU/HrcU family type III secretion system export apparatus switch protein [Desulfosporosinus sp. SB140]|uniref:EscU/YscU/HrcU family type III secretion system export apparatus switch protein n=1 Tax=Desulfosporosinus paludis TaxID=3115649 RepID=UPI00388E387D
MKEKAVALAYDKSGASKIVASGQGEVARNLIETAQEQGIPIQTDAQLVEALIKIDIGQEIPPELYKAVAEILAFVYRLDSEWSEKEIAALEQQILDIEAQMSDPAISCDSSRD